GVGPYIRVVIGMICGIAVLVWSERVFPPFSHSLKVIVVGILYLSIWAAAEMYSLIGGGAAFAAMTIVTGSLVALALVLVALYPWIRVLLVAFIGTLFLYIGWAARYYSAPPMNRTIALGFVTAAVPLQLDALWITIGWVGEAAALLALSQAVPPAVVFRRLGSFALALAVFRLLFFDRFHPQHLLWNLRALTYAMTIA